MQKPIANQSLFSGTTFNNSNLMFNNQNFPKKEEIIKNEIERTDLFDKILSNLLKDKSNSLEVFDLLIGHFTFTLSLETIKIFQEFK